MVNLSIKICRNFQTTSNLKSYLVWTYSNLKHLRLSPISTKNKWRWRDNAGKSGQMKPLNPDTSHLKTRRSFQSTVAEELRNHHSMVFGCHSSAAARLVPLPYSTCGTTSLMCQGRSCSKGKCEPLGLLGLWRAEMGLDESVVSWCVWRWGPEMWDIQAMPWRSRAKSFRNRSRKSDKKRRSESQYIAVPQCSP